MSDRFACLYQPVETFDFAAFLNRWLSNGLTLQNPATQRITYLSEEGDQVFTSRSGLESAALGDPSHTFQLWFAANDDMLCEIRRTSDCRVVEDYSLVGMDKEERDRVSKVLVDRFQVLAVDTANLFLVIDFEGYTIESPWDELSVRGEYTDVICPDILGFHRERFVDFQKCGYLRNRAEEVGDYLIVRKS